jgi:hypothetical protein
LSTSRINRNSSLGRNKTHKTGAFMRVWNEINIY